MKIAGRKITGPSPEIVVLLRKPDNIVIQAGAVLDYTDFQKMCPVPAPPEILKPGGVRQLDTEDKEYVKALNKWAKNKTNFMILQSLNSTPGLEWETVDLNNPDTWHRYQKELQDSGITDSEIGRIIDAVTTACGLNQEKIEEATKSFLAGQEARLKE